MEQYNETIFQRELESDKMTITEEELKRLEGLCEGMTILDRLALLKSDKAIAATRTIAGDYGGATVHCVVLADGFILECGCDGYSPERAALLAETINAADPASFNFGKAKRHD
jgi:hypothetical protein